MVAISPADIVKARPEAAAMTRSDRRAFLKSSSAIAAALGVGSAGAASMAEERSTDGQATAREGDPMPTFRNRLLDCLGGPWPDLD